MNAALTTRIDLLFRILSPLSPLMSIIQRVRRKLYVGGILVSKKAPIPVISVGNITLGGAGKTPFVIMLARFLIESGFKVSVINRGYRGKSKTWPRIVSKNGIVGATSRDVGDEAIMLSRSLPQTLVISGADRYKCVTLSHELGAEIAILDDGYQHLRLKRDLDIVLIDATRDLFKENVFPGGYLREPLSSLGYADCIVLTKTNINSGDTLRSRLRQILSKDFPIFLSWNRYNNLVDLDYNKFSVDICRDQKVFVFAGIANPEYFLSAMHGLGYTIVGSLFFEDHHSYNYKDVKRLLDKAENLGADAIITTHKDIVKILELPEILKIRSSSLGKRFYFLEMETKVEDGFFDFLSKRLKDMTTRHGGHRCPRD